MQQHVSDSTTSSKNVRRAKLRTYLHCVVLGAFVVQLVNRDHFNGTREHKGDITSNCVVRDAVSAIFIDDQDVTQRDAVLSFVSLFPAISNSGTSEVFVGGLGKQKQTVRQGRFPAVERKRNDLPQGPDPRQDSRYQTHGSHLFRCHYRNCCSYR